MSYKRAALYVHKHRSGASERAPWKLLVDMASGLARRELGTAFGASGPQPDVLPDLQLKLRGTAPGSFPSREVGPAKMAEAFLAAATAFACCVGDRRRQRFAAAMEACAEALNDVLEDLRAEEARGWQGRTGERD